MSDEPSLPITNAPSAARHAGQHARETQRRCANRAVLAISGLLATLLAAMAVVGFGWALLGIEAAVIGGMLLLERIALRVIYRWARGAAGEERVGQVLERIRGRGWLVLHDVELGRGNIDHVVIGPAGIYTIETKSHRGRLDVQKIEVGMLKQAYAEAKVIERITGLRTNPLLVFSDAFLTPTAVTRRRGVVILPARMLGKYLQERRGNIPEERVLEVYRRLAVAVSP